MARVIHFEIHADNAERAIKFYESVFNWKFQKWQGPQDYWLIVTGPKDKPGIDGGLLRRKGKIEGESVIAYVCTIEVDSLEETLNKVNLSGGKLAVPKMPVPEVGWLAYIKDTENNIIGLMQNDPDAK